ncbi:MAG: FKBP-type peptidyl-prolyl cis-trans isomerase [Burkholderiaceae bacterium]
MLKYRKQIMNNPDYNDDSMPPPEEDNDFDDSGPFPPTVMADTWVTVHYQIFDSTNQPIEEVPREMRYLHGGYGAIFPKLEQALEDKQVGDKCVKVLQPDDAFGDYEADRLHIVNADLLPEGSEPGMTFEGLPGQAPDGVVYTLTDVAQGKAVLDGNHPLAGISLRYDMSVEKITFATDEEIELERRESGRSLH